MNCVADKMPSQPDAYRKRKQDPAFKEMMVNALRARNLAVTNGT